MQKKLENKITSNISFAFYFKSEERGLHKLVKNRCTVRPNQPILDNFEDRPVPPAYTSLRRLGI